MALVISNPGIKRLVDDLKSFDSPHASRALSIESHIVKIEQENRELKDQIRKASK